MKKLLSVILTICLVIAVVHMGAFSITASAETASSGTTGDCTWTLDGTVLTISGNGEMGNSYVSDVPWGTGITEVIIENGVTSIGEDAFYNCSSLTDITIPNSVINIGEDAFYNTKYYNDTDNWQDDVLYIGNHLIECKTSKTGAYKIKDGTKIIADEAFYYCSSIKNIVIPDSVRSIGSNSFCGCTNLTNIVIPDSVRNIGDFAFYNTGFYNTEENWHDDVLYINNHFIKCNISKIGEYKIKDGTKTIASGAFESCNSLKSITIPNSVISVGYYAFHNCDNLENVYITDIKAWCNINFDNSYSHYYSPCSNPLNYADNLYLNGELVKDIVIPDEVALIPCYAFSCNSLESITIPNSVMIIDDSAFKNCNNLTNVKIGNGVKTIGDGVFSGCNSLESITIPDSVTSVGEYAFAGCSSLNNVYITDIDAWCNIKFAGFDSNPLYCADNLYLNGELVKDLVISNGVKKIPDYAFSCISLESIKIPNSVTSIGKSAFENCIALKNIVIPKSVTHIGFSALYGCISLKSITVPFVKSEKDNTENKHFGYIFGASSSNDNLNFVPTSLRNVIINGGYSVCGGAFYGCANITNITLPDSIINIGNAAFSGCTNLISVTIPDNVTSIGQYAFYNCDSLTKINIPKGISTIGVDTFWGCNSLKDVYITDIEAWCNITFCVSDYSSYSSNPLCYANNLYLNNKLVKDIVIPNSVTEIPYYAFSCDSLKSITIPDSVTSIGNCAFYCCSSLTGITIPNSVTNIGKYAFEECNTLKYVNIANIEAWLNTTFGNYSSNPLYYANNLYLNGELVTDLTIPYSVTSISKYAFYGCKSIKSVMLPNELTILDEFVFAGCDNLSKIYIPKNLTLIKKGNFNNNSWGQNTDLTVYYEGNDDDLTKITVLDANERLKNATVKYNRTGLPIEITNYGDWKIDVETSGIYDIAPSTDIDGFKTENVIVFDKNEKEVKYNADKLGWPLTKGENYTVKLKYCDDKDAYDNVNWKLISNAETIFADTTADGWYNDAVTYAVGAEIMTGYKSNGLFGTSDSIQRQDFIVMLARYDGVDLSTYADKENKFPDVDNNGYYAAAVIWGSENKIITGYTHNGHFGVGDTITREQLVTMLYRYAKYKGRDVNVLGNAEETAMRKFNDYSNVSVFSKDAVLWATEKGVITGKGVNKDAIDPQGNAQRCEVAQIMYNIFKNNIL